MDREKRCLVEVGPEEAGQRLDQVLTDYHASLSRSQIQCLITAAMLQEFQAGAL